jgi:polar amino acid transport system permease protein
MNLAQAPEKRHSHLLPFIDQFSRLPYWLLVSLLLGIFLLWGMINDQDYKVIFNAVRKGIGTTIYVSLIAYALAMVFGLCLSLMRIYRSRFTQEISSFYTEIMRGVPMLVLLYYISFVGAPALVSGLNWLAGPLIQAGVVEELSIRQLDFTWRAILALTLGYSAFIGEIFRSGILSIEKDQTEAGQVEGATYWQIMRYIILPQAIRNILPALGNEFIAILKDSALVSALGVQDITQLGKVYSASTFKFFETYNIVAFLYLVMTMGLASLIRFVEKRLNQ